MPGTSTLLFRGNMRVGGTRDVMGSRALLTNDRSGDAVSGDGAPTATSSAVSTSRGRCAMTMVVALVNFLEVDVDV